jgi:ABC-2 type transport system permease protein
VAPLVSIAAILLAQLGTLTLLTLFGQSAGAGGVGKLWLHAGLPGGTLTLLSGYLVQGLWALPIYAWLLLVSAAAPKVPFVWALLVPLGLVVLESVALGTDTFRHWIETHLRFAALPRPPGAGLSYGTAQPGVGLPEQLSLLFSTEMAVGLAAAALLLAAAVHFRHRNNDL